MKQMFRCEYCEYMSDADSVAKHELTCSKNPAACMCETCKHCKIAHLVHGAYNIKKVARCFYDPENSKKTKCDSTCENYEGRATK